MQDVNRLKFEVNQDKIPSNFSLTIPKAELARKAVMMFKDSYLLDFINVEQIGEREAIDVDERVVEQQIVQNVKQFIMTFGRDFTFVGNQLKFPTPYYKAFVSPVSTGTRSVHRHSQFVKNVLIP